MLSKTVRLLWHRGGRRSSARAEVIILQLVNFEPGGPVISKTIGGLRQGAWVLRSRGQFASLTVMNHYVVILIVSALFIGCTSGFSLFKLSRSPVLLLAIFDPNVHHISINPSLVSAFLMRFVLNGFG